MDVEAGIGDPRAKYGKMAVLGHQCGRDGREPQLELVMACCS